MFWEGPNFKEKNPQKGLKKCIFQLYYKIEKGY